MITRRGLITRAAAFLAAPAIVRVSSLMPVSAVPTPDDFMRMGTVVTDRPLGMALADARFGAVGRVLIFDRPLDPEGDRAKLRALFGRLREFYGIDDAPILAQA